MTQKTNLVLLSSPRVETSYPIMALAQLKAVVQQNGFTCKTFDFNFWLYEKTKEGELSYIWDVSDYSWQNAELFNKISPTLKKLFEEFYNENVKPLNPEVIGVSSLSWLSWHAITLMVENIRNIEGNQCKVILGGPAISMKDFEIKPFYRNLKKNKLIDDYIAGDAEVSIIEYLKGNYNFPGINNQNPNNSYSREEIPPPDYSDFDLSKYKNIHLPISGSRGCVRNCAFCNVNTIWPKFVNKSGKKVAKEMIELYEKHFDKKTHTFRFVDSLINGNQREFESMIDILSEYRNRTNNQLFYSGQFIFREIHEIRGHTGDYFQKLKDSGCSYLTVGIESGSEKVRKEIGKPFSNKAIIEHLEGFRKVKIRMTPLMLVGFPTETDEDFEETLKILNLFSKYKDVVNGASVDTTTILIADTPMYDNYERFHINVDTLNDHLKWESKFNNYKTRVERLFIFFDEAEKLGLRQNTVSNKSITQAKEYLKMDGVLNERVLNFIKSNYKL